MKKKSAIPEVPSHPKVKIYFDPEKGGTCAETELGFFIERTERHIKNKFGTYVHETKPAGYDDYEYYTWDNIIHIHELSLLFFMGLATPKGPTFYPIGKVDPTEDDIILYYLDHGWNLMESKENEFIFLHVAPKFETITPNRKDQTNE
jgi:hypothetical protein